MTRLTDILRSSIQTPVAQWSSLLLAICITLSASAVAEESRKLVNDQDILALSEHMQQMADIFVVPVKTTQGKIDAIADLMFSADKFGLLYNEKETKTAIETVASGSGNCMSLASTFIALARYAGLHAEYLSVQMPPNWQEIDDFYFLMRHMSAYVTINSGTHYTIDFRMVSSQNYKDTKRLPDQHAFAEFYNNLAVEHLLDGSKETSRLYFDKSIQANPKYAPAFTNLGILYNSMQQPAEAEQAYHIALKFNKHNPTALNNIAVLYKQQGRTEEAEQYLAVIERYRMKNPYYLQKLSKQAISDGKLKQAITLLRKSVRIQPDEHQFHFELALAYHLNSEQEKAVKSLQQAHDLAAAPEDQNRYANKLRLLTAARSR